MTTIIYPSSLTNLTMNLKQIFKSNNKPATKMVDNNGEEQTYCNVCSEYKEIISYNEETDYAVCQKCYNKAKAKIDRLIESIARFD